MFRKLIGFRRALAILLLFGLMTLGGCLSVSRHPGVVTVPQPAAAEQDQAKWFEYYQDQFDAFRGSVLRPPENAPMAQRLAYQQASADWGDRITATTWKQTGIWVGVALLVSLITLKVAADRSPGY